jgi:hypothetical protein
MRSERQQPGIQAGPLLGDDRRTFPRVSRTCVVDYHAVTDEEALGTVKARSQGLLQNISGGGLSVHLPECPERGTMLALSIDLPMFRTPVLALGKVVWVCPAEDAGSEVGIEFWWVGWQDSQAQEEIRSFIVSQLQGSTGRLEPRA